MSPIHANIRLGLLNPACYVRDQPLGPRKCRFRCHTKPNISRQQLIKRKICAYFVMRIRSGSDHDEARIGAERECHRMLMLQTLAINGQYKASFAFEQYTIFPITVLLLSLTLQFTSLTMRFSVVILAWFASRAMAGYPCSAPDNGGCQPGDASCWCEPTGTGDQVAPCYSDRACGCGGGQQGVCLYVCIASLFYSVIEITNC